MQRELLSLGFRDIGDVTISELGAILLAPPTTSALFRVFAGADRPLTAPQPQPGNPPSEAPNGLRMDTMTIDEFERRRAANYARGESPSRRIGPQKGGVTA